jgi:capsular exopolysaccharide synthesis family protein
MSRLHRALSRASEGQPPILPPDAGIPQSGETQAGQAAFTVPWTLDGQEATEVTEASRDRVRPAFVTQSARPDLGSRSESREKLVTGSLGPGLENLGLAVEQYRKLAASLHHAQAGLGLKVVVVTSALPGEGKSLTASNLALTLAESYQKRVLLVDADLRRPSLHDIFGIHNGTGLTDCLERDPAQGIPVLEVLPRLFVLPSGRPVDDPTGLLASTLMRGLLEAGRSEYDWVILDTPPIGLLSDAKLVSEMADGVVLVVEAVRTPYPDILRAITVIGRERVLGTVLNRFKQVSGGTKYYSSYYKRAQPPKG